MIDTSVQVHPGAPAVCGGHAGDGPRAAAALLILVGALAVRIVLEASTITAGFIAGAAFGGLLLCGWLSDGRRVTLPSAQAAMWGLAGGAVLVLLPHALHSDAPQLIGMRPDPFLLWVVVTVLVSVSEEALLRGVLFDAIGARSGLVVAVVLTSVTFALMHVPLYGWAVVPVDLAAGVWLAGLRLMGGGIAAPGIAHVLADLATW